MPGETADDRLARIIESLVERHRRGEITSITEYAEKHPELADGIRDVYEALRLLDHGKPSSILPPGSSRESAEEGTQEGKASDLLSLGEYRIVREVGRGGMGVVYEAVQEPLGRRVALKVLPFHSFLDKTYLERFRREARAAASLQHPNIVPVHGVGEDRGTHLCFPRTFVR
jgi:serine/threonine protein kinase